MLCWWFVLWWSLKIEFFLQHVISTIAFCASVEKLFFSTCVFFDKNILRYLPFTINKSLVTGFYDVSIYTDDSFGQGNTRYSTSGIIICCGKSTLMWKCNRQSKLSTTLSCEAESRALLDGYNSMKPMREILNFLNYLTNVVFRCDNLCFCVHVSHLSTVINDDTTKSKKCSISIFGLSAISPLVWINQRVLNRYRVRGLHRSKIRLQAKGWFIKKKKKNWYQ